MTEDEAKTKWCPFVRYQPARKFSFGRIKAAINRWLDDDDKQLNPEPCHCIGSECMAWRDDKSANQCANARMENQDHGYCGLAGKP